MKKSNTNGLNLLLSFIAFTALILAAAVIWVPEMWALPFPFIPRIASAVLIWLGASFIAWRWTLSGTDTTSGVLGAALSSRLAWGVLIALIVGAALLPMQTFFYGDGGLLIPQIYKLAMGEPYQYDLLLNAKSSPLAGIIIIGLSHSIPDVLLALGLPLPETGVYPFTWLSVISLIGLAAGILAFTDKTRLLLTVLFVFGTAGTLLYFGYVEYYTLAYTAIALYLITAERALRHKGSVFFPVVFFLIAVAAHYETLALIPSLTFLLMATGGHEEKFRLKALLLRSGIVLALAVGAYFILGFHASESRIVMPLFPVSNASGTQEYTLLSAAHLRDMLNVFLLLAPVQLFALLSLLLSKERGKLFGSVIGRFYFLAFLYFTVFLFFANTSLGLARDWDIAAPLGLIVSLGALGLLTQGRVLKSGHVPLPLVYTGVAGILVAGGWVFHNVQPERSASRFETILSLDSDKMYRDYAHSGYEALRKYYRNVGNDEKDIALSQTKIELLDYPTDYVYLIDKSLQLSAGNQARYLELQRWMLRRLEQKARQFNNEDVRSDYGISISQIDSLAEVIAANAVPLGAYRALQPGIANVATQTGAEQPYGIVIAFDAYERKQYPKAADMFQQAVDLGFHNPAIFRLLATSLALQHRNSEALAAIEYGLDNYPNDPNLLVTYADWLLQAGLRPGDARRALERAALYTTNPETVQKIARLLTLSTQVQNQSR